MDSLQHADPNISIDESLNGSLQIGFTNVAEPDLHAAFGYLEDGKGFVPITAYDYSKKSCDFDNSKDYGIREVFYATVRLQPVFVGATRNDPVVAPLICN